jgi:NAD(P)-dependent dehydrogenase (short-subunit alcohol dehydrogenase family)
LRLAKAGAKAIVVNYSRSSGDAETTAAELTALGTTGVAHKADIASEPEVLSMVAGTVERFGRLDVLVNNAGTTHFIPHPDLDALTDKVWSDILNVNIKGTFYCCRAAAPALRKQGGAIVNIASIAAHRAGGSSIAYAVSKAGVVQLTRALALTLAPDVRVNSVSPGLVSSRWFRGRFGDEAANALESNYTKNTPMGEIATPDHVAQAVMGLIESDLVTGQDLVVDGGLNIKYG